jgi:hypothetical protein
LTKKLIPLNIVIGKNKKAGDIMFPIEEGCNLDELAREIKDYLK